MTKLSILFLFIFLNTLSAAVILTDSTQKYNNFTLEYMYDKNSSLTIQDIQKTKFSTTIPSQFTQGYKYGNAWFKLKLKNDSKTQDFVLYFTESIWSELDLYSKQDSSWKIEKNGLNIPLNERGIKDNSPAFNINIPTGETSILYIKGNTIASQLGEFQVYTKKEFFNPSRITISEWYLTYAFILFAFILLNLYNFIRTREHIYAYYMAYVLIYIIFSFMHSGVYISFGFPNWQEGLHVLGQLTLFSLLLFSREFLELKTTYPLMRKVFNWLSIISLIFVLLLSQNIPYSTVASNVFFSGVLITIVFVAIKVLKGGFDGAKYYLIALMLYLPSMAIMALNFNTILPNTDITRYSFLVGAFIEIFLFTLILTNRYVDVNREKIEAQNELLDEKNNNEQRLISEIEKQTDHLTKANYRLIKQTEELQEIKKQLTVEATTDMLSGLYNRRYFFEASTKSFYTAMRYKQNLSMLMLDIDHFKNINDSYGHMIGDSVIRICANILKKLSRTSDIIARYGGEEFIVILPETNLEEALLLAERIRKEVQNRDIDLNDDKKVYITISIGVSQLDNEDDTSIENIIQRCDDALYSAKKSGRNRVHSS